MDEFNLIQKYFTWNKTPRDVVTAVGDDAAVIEIPPNKQLVTSIDTLVSGVHFPENTPPDAIGHKALAVNLSDLAAMGASPRWFTLALTLPEIDETWLEGFSAGLKELAQQHDCFLIGGDTTRGPLSISIQVMGVVDTGKALLRSDARVGDKIYVTGTLGDAAAGLQSIFSKDNSSNKNNNKKSVLEKEADKVCQKHLNMPTPRIVESNIIKHFASTCIDVSDGLLQDLTHILEASGVAAELDSTQLPLSSALMTLVTDNTEATQLALTGGDDYELLFTIPESREANFVGIVKGKAKVTCIGVITDITENQNTITDENGNILTNIDKYKGYNHFHV
ncbi:MAG: thiamine-phosphate kinase [Cocleimonas sp.]|nr:thiamine-phosphate kinase [Cocleimonas sp.]